MSFPSPQFRSVLLALLASGLMACAPASTQSPPASGGSSGSGGAMGTGGAFGGAGSGGAQSTASGGSGTGGAAAAVATGGAVASGGVSSGGAPAASGGSGSGGASTGIGSGGSGAGGAGASTGGGSGQTGGASGPVSHNEIILYDDDGRLMYVNNSTPARNWVVNSGSGRDIQLIGGGRLLFGKSNGWDEYRLSDGALMAGQHGFAGTQTAHRMVDGNTILASVAGTNIVLRIVNSAGQMQRQITYAGFSYVRCIRPTTTGTFLVAADTVLFEGDDQGRVLWRVTVPAAGHMYKAMRLPNGNVVAASGYGATLVIYNAAHTVVQTIGGLNQPNAAQVAPFFYADFHVMPNGNYFVVNSQADRIMNGSVQLLEYNPAGTLVWQQKQPAGVRSLESAIVLDGLDLSKLHVQPEGRLVPVP